jgi:hypothetical protein
VSLKHKRSKITTMQGFKRSQSGMASVVIVSVLTVVITLIVIGFARIMNRTILNSANRQQSAAANYAAQSALNDLADYIKKYPQTSATTCGGGASTGSLIGTQTDKGPFYSDAQLNNNATNTRYTCLLVNPVPTDLLQDPVDPGKSWVIKASTQYPASKMLLSWESADAATAYPPALNKFYDTTSWRSSGYQSLLRVTFYPIPTSESIAAAQASAKTIFLYPQASSGPAPQKNFNTDLTDGSILPVNCTKSLPASYSGTAKFACNLILTNLLDTPQFNYMYVRVTSVYDRARVDIQEDDLNNDQMQFIKSQAVVDATAVAGSVAKRLQGRVDISKNANGLTMNIDPSKDEIPEFGARSADTLCKRLEVTPLNNITIDGTFNVPLCSQSLTPPPAPIVTATPATGISYSSATLNGTVNPNNSPGFSFGITSCFFQYSTDLSYGQSASCSSLPGPGSAPVAVSAAAGSMPPNTTIHFRLCATNQYSSSPVCSGDMSFKTLNPPPPTPKVGSADPHGGYAYVNGTVNPNGWPVTQCYFEYGTSSTLSSSSTKSCDSLPGSGSSAVGVTTTLPGLSANTTYYYRLCAKNDYNAVVCDPASLTGGGMPSFTTPNAPPVTINISNWSVATTTYSYHISVTDNGDGAGLWYCATYRNGSWLVTDYLSGSSADVAHASAAVPGDTYKADCYAIDGANGQSTASVQGAVDIIISSPTTSYNTEYTRTYGTTVSPAEPNDCRDGLHNYAVCFTIEAYQEGYSDPTVAHKAITKCNVSPSLGDIGNSAGTPHWSSPGHWINLQLGWNQSPIPSTTYPTDQYFNMPHDGTTVTITCYGTGGFSNSANVNFDPTGRGRGNVNWQYCASPVRQQQGQYYSDMISNNCTDVSGGGAGGGGGGGGGTQTCTYGGSVSVPPGCSTCWDGSTAIDLAHCPTQPICKTACGVYNYEPDKNKIAWRSWWWNHLTV